jgi:hypothetical protein
MTYHLVLVTKYRRKYITRPMLEMPQDIVAQRCKDWGGDLLDCNGEADQPRSYPDVPSTEPRPVTFRQQREDDQQQTGPARVRQSASMRLSQACSGPGLTASPHVAAHR